jgi:hypothetical protein
MLEQGLISFYISKVQTIGVRALAGEPFQKPVEGVMAEAFAHLSGAHTRDPLKNLKAMAGQLTLLAEHTHPSQEPYRACAEFAAGLVRKHLAAQQAAATAPAV